MRIAFVFFWPVLTFLRCTGVYYTFGFPGLCLLWRQDFVVSWFCSTHFCVLARLKNIFFISDFFYVGLITLTQLRMHWDEPPGPWERVLSPMMQRS